MIPDSFGIAFNSDNVIVKIINGDKWYHNKIGKTCCVIGYDKSQQTYQAYEIYPDPTEHESERLSYLLPKDVEVITHGTIKVVDGWYGDKTGEMYI